MLAFTLIETWWPIRQWESGVTPFTLRYLVLTSDKKIGFKVQFHSKREEISIFPSSSFLVKAHVRQGMAVLHYTYTDLLLVEGKKANAEPAVCVCVRVRVYKVRSCAQLDLNFV